VIGGKNEMIFIDQVRWQCRINGAKPALWTPGGAVNYERLGACLDNVCGRLRSHRITAGAVYGLLFDNSLLHIVSMLALDELGAITASLSATDHLESLHLAAVLTDRDIAIPSVPAIRVHPNWLHIESDYHYEPERPAASEACRLILTSGTTGTPKAVPRTRTVLRKRVSQTDYIYGNDLPTCARLLCWLGVNTGLGYVSLMHALSRGGMFCLPDPSIERTVWNIARYRLTAIVASPQALSELAAYCRRKPVTLPGLKVILSTGSLLPQALADSVRATICSHIINVYGSTEAGIIATAPVEALDLANGEVGFVIPETHVDIVDGKTGARAKEGGGKVHIRADTCVDGYLGADKADAFDEDGFFPGDSGHLSRNGLLSIFGRESHVVNLGGLKTTVEQIEGRISTAPGIRDVAVVLVPDHFGIAQLLAIVVPEGAWSEELFWQHCHRHIEREYWPARLKTSDRIPRSANGKIDRSGVALLV